MPMLGAEKRLESSARLDIDFSEQRELVHNIRALSLELDESPMATPAKDKHSLRGIALRRPNRERPGSYMSIESTESPGRQPKATIVITDKSKNVGNSALAYHYRSSLDVWEERRPAQTAPIAIHDSSAMVSLLDNQMTSGVLEGLQDHIPTGIEIVHMLVSQLRNSARTRMRDSTYASSRIILGGEDYATTVESGLRIRENNGRVQHSLAVNAVYLTDMGEVDKTYSYDTIHTSRTLISADGRVVFSTIDEIPKARLDGFAQRDQEQNHPVDALNHAIEQLREEYGLAN